MRLNQKIVWLGCGLAVHLSTKKKKKNYFLAGKRGLVTGMRGNCELWWAVHWSHFALWVVLVTSEWCTTYLISHPLHFLALMFSWLLLLRLLIKIEFMFDHSTFSWLRKWVEISHTFLSSNIIPTNFVDYSALLLWYHWRLNLLLT